MTVLQPTRIGGLRAMRKQARIWPIISVSISFVAVCLILTAVRSEALAMLIAGILFPALLAAIFWRMEKRANTGE